jgi:mannosyltransferase OCH1-like enzyme
MYKMVHQIIISDNKNIKIGNNYDNIVNTFKGFKHIIWTHNKILGFIIKNKDFDVLSSVNNIKSYAFKSDIARYYLVNKIGGFYTDLNTFFYEIPNIENVDMVFFKDNGVKDKKAIMNGFFYSNPKNKILDNALKICIDNVKNKYYGSHPLDVTGPNVLGESFYKNCNNNKFLLENFYGMQDSNHIPGYYVGNKLVAKYKPNNLKNSDSGLVGGNSYETLWFDKKLYTI